MLPGNFPCNPQSRRERNDKEEDRFVLPKTYLQNPKRVLLAWLGFEQSCKEKLVLHLDRSSERDQAKPTPDDREEDRFIKESGATNDMSARLKSSSLSLVRFRTILSKEIGSRLGLRLSERSSETNLER
uniref:Uncharacterized protein n=1 Tax=Salix viminalis TaxID=40686 RepID=A0A6N2KIX1_SALVM